MKLVFIIGNTSVGKMTVGQELTKITSLKLFHNHMAIEPVLDVFGKFDNSIIKEIRDVIFKNFAKSNNYGLIFTVMVDFDSKEDLDYLDHVKSFFTPYKSDFYYVELISSQETRLKRNITENRLNNKPSKRDLVLSNARLKNDDLNHRLESKEGEITFDNYLRIDNNNLEAKEVANIIKDTFKL